MGSECNCSPLKETVTCVHFHPSASSLFRCDLYVVIIKLICVGAIEDYLVRIMASVIAQLVKSLCYIVNGSVMRLELDIWRSFVF